MNEFMFAEFMTTTTVHFTAFMPDTSLLSSLGSRTPSSKHDSRFGSTRGVRFATEQYNIKPPG